MRKTNMLALFLALFLQFQISYAQELNPLFQSDSILKITIKLSLDEVLNDLVVRDYHEAKLSYKRPDGSVFKHKAKVKIRGNNRAKVTTCRFPPLKVNFKKSKLENSVFEGQNKIKLVTHCNSNKNANQLILKEYLTYKLYQQITPYSLGVRLCEITYIDTSNDNEESIHYGFFIEDIDHLAARSNMIVYEDSIANQDVCVRAELDKMTVFQYMIGNLDWSVPNRHNMKLIAESSESLPVAVPYDFDFAGFVGAPYAKPPAEFGLQSVKQRFFMGFCRSEGEYELTLSSFKEKKNAILSVVEQSTLLTDKNKKQAFNYLQGFFVILDKPKQAESRIIKGCRVDHKHLYQYEKH